MKKEDSKKNKEEKNFIDVVQRGINHSEDSLDAIQPIS